MTARLYTFAIGTAAIGLYLLWQALQLPGSEEVTTFIGPRTWPVAILSLMLALVAVMVLMLVLKAPGYFTDDETPTELPGDATTVPVADEPAVAVEPAHLWRYAIVLGLTIAYTVVMAYTGYAIATAVFTAAVTVVLGERRPLRILLTTVGAVVLVAIVFDRLLNIPLP